MLMPVTIMPQEATTNSFGIFLAALGLILSSGAFAWFFRSGTTVRIADMTARQALQKADETSPKVTTLESRIDEVGRIAEAAHSKAEVQGVRIGQIETTVAEHGAIIQEIRTRMAKLDRVDEVVAAVQSMREVVMRQWENDERRFNRVETDVRTVSDTQRTNS